MVRFPEGVEPSARRGSEVLDLGCGLGQDTRFLLQHGHSVVVADFSEEALEITRRRAPAAKTPYVDLSRGLPFVEARFGVIVASLSLHYFPWQMPMRILQEVRRSIEPGGYLLAPTRRETPATPQLKNKG